MCKLEPLKWKIDEGVPYTCRHTNLRVTEEFAEACAKLGDGEGNSIL
jgi:hypothetical protein